MNEENKNARNVEAPQAEEMAESVFIRIPEAMAIMGCSRATAQRCIAEVNKRMKVRGCFVISGRCNRREFYKAIGLER